jgi:hypothetical protein
MAGFMLEREMKFSRVTALAAVLAAGVSAPVLADWDQVGTVQISGHRDRDVARFDFGGPVERLRLRADRSDIRCDSVSARFGNRNDREIFSGRIDRGRTVDVDLPGRERNITRLTFRCQARDDRGGQITVVADVGRYRRDWMSGPNWGASWAHVFNWGSNLINNWQYAGEVRFEGRGDSESVFTGWRGRGSDAIALKPVDANARCSRITASFERRPPRPLNLHNGDFLRQGEFNAVDLPGDKRNITSLSLNCRATDARRVTIQIYTSK